MQEQQKVTKVHIKDGRVVDPKTGFDGVADIYIADGLVAAIGERPDGFAPDTVIDASGKIVCPGLVDLSTRLGSLGSELAAAVAGGVTAVACPPDTNPPLDEPGLVERLVRHSEALGLARVFPIGALTQQLAGEKLSEMNSLVRAGCLAFSQAKEPMSTQRRLGITFGAAAVLFLLIVAAISVTQLVVTRRKEVES